MIIRSRAPVRISFGGGGTDLNPYREKYGGLVLNSTINKYVYASLTPIKNKNIKVHSVNYKRTYEFSNINEVILDDDIDLIKAVIIRMKPDYGFKLIVRSDIPPNTGLGSSGSVAVALIGVLNYYGNKNLKKEEIAELAYDIEMNDLHNISGKQDQYASVFGGLNLFKFCKVNSINPIYINKNYIYDLEKHLLLVFLGNRGESGEIQKTILDQTGKNTININILNKLKEICRKMCGTLLSGDLFLFGKLLDESWYLKKELSNKVSNSYIDKIYEGSKEHGVIGGKITGAGGGGCMILLCKPDYEHYVSEYLKSVNVGVINFTFESQGLTVWKMDREYEEMI